ncbi:MAG: glycoside hydrolase 43 family protein [Pseudomonadota bacterium]
MKLLTTGARLAALIAIALCVLDASAGTTRTPHAWVPDLGNGEYQNPVLNADYSDPDLIRHGDMYYMTSSSFNSTPGLPLLQSSDMVNWELLGHALPQQVPLDVFATPQHGKGVWAPCLRFHDGKFWIFYPDPDFGIYVITAEKFTGPWSAPHLLLAGKGIIDPTPLWDDDGKAYLLHAWAKSRSGISNVLTLRRMAPDASRVLDEDDKGGTVVIDGNKLPNYRTLEGPKFYKYHGYYYVFAPAGGVESGWQSVFRSKQIGGPYEDKIVMDQGGSPTNGPHQGAWVQTAEGADWFMHFQDKRAYGRVVHLQPMRWKNDWPVIGEEKGDSGVGQPVLRYRKPVVGAIAMQVPPTSDEFTRPVLGVQWQWNANWQASWYSLTAKPGSLRLFTQYDARPLENQNLWDTPSILLQKLPAEKFTVDTHLRMHGGSDGDRAGLVLYGLNYAWIGVRRVQGKLQLTYVTCIKADANCKENDVATVDIKQQDIALRMRMKEGGVASFAYSLDNKRFSAIGEPFVATMGRWVGAQIGLFSIGSSVQLNKQSYVDVDYFKIIP